VNYRFEPFRSVRDHGQKYSWDFVRLIPGDGTYHLRGVHHRVAALAVCGHQQGNRYRFGANISKDNQKNSDKTLLVKRSSSSGLLAQ
jgi:hypothetical protein